jgi:hypothetical protein
MRREGLQRGDGAPSAKWRRGVQSNDAIEAVLVQGQHHPSLRSSTNADKLNQDKNENPRQDHVRLVVSHLFLPMMAPTASAPQRNTAVQTDTEDKEGYILTSSPLLIAPSCRMTRKSSNQGLRSVSGQHRIRVDNSTKGGQAERLSQRKKTRNDHENRNRARDGNTNEKKRRQGPEKTRSSSSSSRHHVDPP